MSLSPNREREYRAVEWSRISVVCAICKPLDSCFRSNDGLNIEMSTEPNIDEKDV